MDFLEKRVFLFKFLKIKIMMRELKVRVSDNQFDTLVNFLRTLPYVQLPESLKKKDAGEQLLEKEQVQGKQIPNNALIQLTSLGEIDNTPFNLDEIKKKYSIKWENFHEVVELFKDVPLENFIEQHTELHTD